MERSRAALAVLVAAQLGGAVPGFALDCNLNGVDDAADIAGNTSLDCQGDGVPDECDVFPVTYDGSSAAAGNAPVALATGGSAVSSTFVVAHLTDDTVQIFENAGGVLTPGEIVPVGDRPEAVVAGQLASALIIGAGSGPPHIATADANDGTVTILQQGLGGYVPMAGSPFAVGGAPTGLAIGDLTGDAEPDLVVTDRASGSLVALVNDGLGGFFVSLGFATGANPRAVVLADVDADGDPDALVGARTPGQVVLLENDAGLTFLPAASVYAVGDPVGLAAADVDADGDVDLAVLSATLRAVHVLANDGSGGFSLLGAVPVGVQPTNVRFADLDGNGTPDLVVPSAGDDAVTVALGDGTGSFGTPVNLAAGDGPVDAVALDFDRDGRLDLVSADVLSSTLTLLEARRDAPDCDGGGVPDACELAGDDCDGSGVRDACEAAGGRGFAPPLDAPASGSGVAIDAGDFDGDGRDDALVAAGDGVRFFRGKPDGSLAETASYATGTSASEVLAVDVDGDADLDVVVANDRDDTVAILRGTGTGAVAGSSLHPTVPDPEHLASGDLDRDGDVDLAVKGSGADATVLLLEGGSVASSATVGFGGTASGLAVADVDGDGHADLLSLVRGGSSAVQALRNEGGGTLTPLPPLLTAGASEVLAAFAAGDVSGDGVADLAALVIDARTRVLRLLIALNDGAGVLAVSQALPFAGLGAGDLGVALFLFGKRPLQLGDADGDGDLDLLVSAGRALRVHENDGSGGFGLASPVLVGRNYRDYALGDADGDGADDLLMPASLGSDAFATTLLSRALPAEGVCFGSCLRRAAPSCIEMESGRLRISERRPGRERWTLSLRSPGAPVPADFFGDPVAGDTGVGVCVYDAGETLAGGLAVSRGGDVCGARGRPCWKRARAGFRYKDPDAAADGVRTVAAASPSSTSAHLSVKAGNDARRGRVSLPLGSALALQDASAARVQVLTTDGACFEATLPDVRRADGSEFDAKTP